MICGAGFALMAWREAQRRKGYDGSNHPAEREGFFRGDDPTIFPKSAEYYRIIDNATHAVEHGPRCGGVTVTVHL